MKLKWLKVEMSYSRWWPWCPILAPLCVLFCMICSFSYAQSEGTTSTPANRSAPDVQVGIMNPISNYGGWIMEFRDKLFNDDMQARLVHEYETRIGQFLFTDHPLNNSNDRLNRKVFNRYSGSYVNVREEERHFGEFMHRLIVDGMIRSVLDHPALRRAQQVHQQIQDATRVSFDIAPPPPPPPPEEFIPPSKRNRPPPPARHVSLNWDIATYNFYMGYSGPEGSLSLGEHIPIARIPFIYQMRPVVYYNFPVPAPYSLSLNFNTSNHSHGAAVGRELAPGMGLSISVNGNIPNGPTKEWRSTVGFGMSF